MIYGIVSAPARPGRGTRATIIAAALLSAAATSAFAQQQAPAAKPPAAKPAAPARPAQPPAAQPGQPAQQGEQAQQAPQLIYSNWTKICGKGEQAGAKQVCFTGKEARLETGAPVATAVLIEPEGEPKKLRVSVPLTMSIQMGTRIIIDQNTPAQAGYVVCFVNGCMSDYEVNADMLGKLKKGQQLLIQAMQMNNQPLTVQLPLADFAKAYDGPPTDPKVMEDQQKKLQDELQARAEKARKELETKQQQGQAPAAGKTQ